VSPVKYELGFYIPDDDILHSHRRENLKSYIPFVYFSSQDADQKRTLRVHRTQTALPERGPVRMLGHTDAISKGAPRAIRSTSVTS
jgi:hypothetical protein